MSKLSGKFDPEAEAEVRTWIQQLLGICIPENELDIHLKDGVVLCQLMQTILTGTPPDSLPAACKSIKLKPRKSERGAIQMENIEIFLKAAAAYGVQQSGLFSCNDLYEGKNIPMVIATVLQVGSEAQRNKYDGPTCGPKPTPRNKTKNKFSRQQIRAGHGMLSLQTGTNKFASQKGMTFGGVRHCADIRADDMNQEGQGDIGLQSGSNKFASQAGMSFGAIRHIADIRADDACNEGQGDLSLQSGTNKFASQKGMSFGSVRHCADIRADDMEKEGQKDVGLQMGSNKYASQKGMSFGSVRHCADIRADEYNQDSNADVGLQMGSNKYASQKGMSFGAVRHVADIRADESCQEGAGIINIQAGWNKGASQSGMRGFGAPRGVSDIKIADICDDYEFEDEEEVLAEEGELQE